MCRYGSSRICCSPGVILVLPALDTPFKKMFLGPYASFRFGAEQFTRDGSLELVEAEQHGHAQQRKQRRGNRANDLEGDLWCGKLTHEDGRDIGHQHA